MANRTNPREIEDIQKRMAQLRRGLHQDVHGAVRGVEDSLNWRAYVRQAPWVAAGASFLLGYFLVPKRSTRAIQQIPVHLDTSTHDSPRSNGESVRQEKQKERFTLLGTAFGLIAPVVARAAQGYALQLVDNLVTSQMSKMVPQAAAGSPTPSERTSTRGLDRPSSSRG